MHGRWTGRGLSHPEQDRDDEPREAGTPGARQDHLSRPARLVGAWDELMRMGDPAGCVPPGSVNLRRYSRHLNA
jgi:hypothetical protein